MADRMIVDGDEMNRLVLMRMDLDRYEAQLIPDLQHDVHTLHHTLRRLVEAVEEAEHALDLEASTSHRTALHEAQRLLEERKDPSRNESAAIRLEFERRTRRARVLGSQASAAARGD
jgi:hypothetical protein